MRIRHREFTIEECHCSGFGLAPASTHFQAIDTSRLYVLDKRGQWVNALSVDADHARFVSREKLERVVMEALLAEHSDANKASTHPPDRFHPAKLFSSMLFAEQIAAAFRVESFRVSVLHRKCEQEMFFVNRKCEQKTFKVSPRHPLATVAEGYELTAQQQIDRLGYSVNLKGERQENGAGVYVIRRFENKAWTEAYIRKEGIVEGAWPGAYRWHRVGLVLENDEQRAHWGQSDLLRVLYVLGYDIAPFEEQGVSVTAHQKIEWGQDFRERLVELLSIGADKDDTV